MKKDLVNSYKENGYITIKNLVDSQLLNQQLKNIYKLLLRFHKPPNELKKMDQPWNSLLFHQEIIRFRQEDSKLFSGFYDSLQSSIALTRIVASKKLVQCAADLLELDPCELSSTAQECRVDVPYDTRNALQWHQDRSYSPANASGLNSLTCWLPLVELTHKSGFLQVCAKSHLDGAAAGVVVKFPYEKGLDNKNDNEHLFTNQIPINENVNLEKYKVEAIKISLGDVLFISNLLFHRSGKNESNKIRFSCQNRLHGATSQDFIPFRSISQSNPYVKEIMLKSGTIIP